MRVFLPKTVDEGLYRFCADCANKGDCVESECPLRYFSPHPAVRKAVRTQRLNVFVKETMRFEKIPIEDIKTRKETQMRISFIIASYRPKMANSCIESIQASVGSEHQFVIIDTRPENLNIFQAYDIGAEQAKYSILCFIHEDTRILSSSYWLNDVSKYFADPKVGVLGVAGSKDLTGTGRWWEGMGQPGGNRLSGIAIHTNEENTWSNAYGAFDQVLVLDGLCLIIKSETYRRLKGYHYADMPPYTGYDFYDIDLCFRTHLAGDRKSVV